MSFDLDTLYKLLPAVYRIRDIGQLSGDTSLLGQEQAADGNSLALPLRALMKVFAEQIDVLQQNLAQLYDDQFIETCAEWAIPYIGDLVGYQVPHDTSSQSLRSEVANTIRYRKRKGTVLLLEQLVRDVTGWDAHIVEFFQLLATTQYMQRLRPENHTIDVRQITSSEDVYPPSPFEKLAHTIDVRNIATGQGRYNIPNIGIFIWRLKAYRLSRVPVTQAALNDRNRYLYFFNPLGTNLQLFTHPQHPEAQLAGPLAVAAPISRVMLARAFSDYYGPDKSLWLTVATTIDGKEVDMNLLPDPLAEQVQVSEALYTALTAGHLDFPLLAQLSTSLYKGLTALQNIPYRQLAELIDKSETLSRSLVSVENLDFQMLADLITKSKAVFDGLTALREQTGGSFSTFTISDLSDEPGKGTWKASRDDAIAIDPVLGRLAFPRRRQGQRKIIPAPKNLRATFYYGFSADMGGGEYYREDSFTQGLPLLQRVTSQLATIQKALDALAGDGVVEITDSGRMEGILTINAQANQRIELRAADFTRSLLVLTDKKKRPALVITGEEGAEVTLNGLILTDGPLHIEGNLRRLVLRHCTLVPATEGGKDGKPLARSRPGIICESTHTLIEIDKSIVGRLEIKRNARVRITNSIVDATRADGLAYSGPSAIGAEAAHLDSLAIENSTIIGRVRTTTLELASNAIFYARSAEEGEAPIYVERRQQGCVRFSYLPAHSRVPLQRYRCQPDKDGATNTIELHFTSLRYGDAGYAQLSQRTSPAILQGADDNAEMGTFHNLFQPQRATNLELRLQEYLRFGFETGIIYLT